MAQFRVGSIVRCRNREWVVQPSTHPDILQLRPLGGIDGESCGIYLPIEGDTVTTAQFPPPDPAMAGDFVAGQLLRNAARLSLRNGAGPFRSLGRLGARPRPYQLVPLLMALRLDPVRLLIADDVGVGKTVEAALIVRELLDRGEIKRFTVLCPPHLCDQWSRELEQKFGIEATVVRSSTAAALDRTLPNSDISVFEYYPFTVASIDYVKHDRHRANFLRACPELVIVDEVHTAARPSGPGSGQQQRYDLIRAVADDQERHLLLLSATPHSGIEDAFVSLLGLLRPEFETYSMTNLSSKQRDLLAQHFVQRRRGDVVRWLDEETPFPKREHMLRDATGNRDITYRLAQSSAYRSLFNEVFEFARELVHESLREANAPRVAARTRVRYWAALALLRCVMSSPAAAEKALMTRARKDPTTQADDLSLTFDDELFSSAIHDRSTPAADDDVEPTHVIEEGSTASEAARLQKFAEKARQLRGANDPKLQSIVPVVARLLKDDFQPIIYCRYIATARYVAEELTRALKPGNDTRILAVTGDHSEEERESLIAELSASPRRLLVATDCLSEGINLQEAFNAVIHYDLPWNPNRLEQREGRVDRYGQPAPVVRMALVRGEDNPIDEAVMRVLLRKAVTIHRTLGISVPLPVSNETVVDALIATLFKPPATQLTMFEAIDPATFAAAEQTLAEVELQWAQAEHQAEQSRTRFAQHRIQPQEVARELEESDAVLGDADTVRSFVRASCERIGAPLVALGAHAPDHWRVPIIQLPLPVRERVEPLLRNKATELLITFTGVAAEGVLLVGRNHPLTMALADYALETALTPEDGLPVPAARSGVLRTKAVERRTFLALLRVRMLIATKRNEPLLAEELVVAGFVREPGGFRSLEPATALDLLTNALPDANIAHADREHQLHAALDLLPQLAADLTSLAHARAERLAESHSRVRTATRMAGKVSVEPHLPPDVLGLYVLLPLA
ncbi:MAG: DEAD/DEAH box helicase [Chloroflexi bacterium]|nr:DEAD/DEAH box helicase [Chloroflexota bacterium]